MMKGESGFTLIELVVVIVILGVLSVVAAPRFLNFNHDAKAAVIEGMKGSVDAAAQLAYSRAAIDNEENNPSYHIEVGDKSGHVAFGYPTVERGGMENFLNAESGYHDLDAEWTWAAYNSGGSVSDPDYWLVTQSKFIANYTGSDFNSAIEDSGCYVKYTASMEQGASFETQAYTDGC
ncbi:prepilin-type N-terminal cleavage/methylation domain-containing protein [Vibrio paucivorans]